MNPTDIRRWAGTLVAPGPFLMGAGLRLMAGARR